MQRWAGASLRRRSELQKNGATARAQVGITDGAGARAQVPQLSGAPNFGYIFIYTNIYVRNIYLKYI